MEPGQRYTLKEVAAFLDGTAPLDGVYFSGGHPTEKGAFWWRKHLRAAVEAACVPAMPPDVAALVERLKWRTLRYNDSDGYYAYIGDDVALDDAAASAIKAQAAEIVRRDAIAMDLQMLCDKQAAELERLKAAVEEAQANSWSNVGQRERAEAAEAKLSEARADGMREAARITYGAPHYVSGMDPDEFGVMPPGSPYDRGRHDAMKAILSAIGEARDE